VRSSLDRNKSWESATLPIGADHIGTSLSPEVEIPPGSQEHGARAWGHPETWEVSSFSLRTREGQPADQVQALHRVRDVASEQTHRLVIPRNEGNEVKRDERREVGAPQ
jgi:hypothetical protein